MNNTKIDYEEFVEDEKLSKGTDIIENYLLENFPHIYNTTTRSGIKKWVQRYLVKNK